MLGGMSLRPLLPVLILACAAAAEPDPLRELVDQVRDLEAQIALVERYAVAAPERAALWTGAIRGLVAAADPYGAYLTAEEVAVRDLGQEAMRVGFGFDWRHDGEGALVTRVVPGSPADAAGVRVGWRVLAADAVEPSAGARFAETLGRGPERKRLRLRALDGSVRESELTRSELADDGLAAVGEPAPGILHLRLGRFLPAADAEAATTVTAAAVRAALARDGVRAAVLDLRGCAGGNLQAAIEIAAAWLPADAVVIEQVGRDPARSRTWRSAALRLPDLPLAVLIDGGTASAAEVLAHALRRGRGSPLIGAPSHGKWSVQQLFLLPRGDGILLTVARLRPPGGTVLDAPLAPDIAVEQAATATWRAWAGEGPDAQLARAVEVATALAVARPR